MIGKSIKFQNVEFKVTPTLPCLNESESQTSKCKPTLQSFEAVTKAVVISLIHKILNLNWCMDVQLSRFSTLPKYVLVSFKETKRYRLQLTLSQGHCHGK